MQITGQALTPTAVLRNENEAIDLSSDDDLGDDALELLIKSKQGGNLQRSSHVRRGHPEQVH